MFVMNEYSQYSVGKSGLPFWCVFDSTDCMYVYLSDLLLNGPAFSFMTKKTIYMIKIPNRFYNTYK